MAHNRADYRNERAQLNEDCSDVAAESCDCKTLYYLNFGNCNIDLPKTLDVQSFDGLVGRSELGLVIDSRVFTQTVPTGELGRLDYYKFYAAIDKSFPLEVNKDVTFEAWIAGQQYFNEDIPVPPVFVEADAVGDIRADPRLASAGYMLVDDQSGLFFGHLLTDTAHYAVYGRNDFARLRQSAAGNLLAMNSAFGNNGLSVANILGLNLEDIVLDSGALGSGALGNLGNLADLASLGNGFRILANGTNGWDMEKCKKKRSCIRTACTDRGDCYGIDPRQLLDFVNTASHLNFIRIDTRLGEGGLTDFTKSGVRFRLNQDAVDWLINGIKVFTLIGIGSYVDPQYRGVRGPGAFNLAQLCQLRFHFGTFSFLDSAQPNFNYLDVNDPAFEQGTYGALVQLATTEQYVVPIAGPDGEVASIDPALYFAADALGEDPTLRLFGQGAVLILKDIRMKVCDSKFDEYIYDELGNQCPNIDLIPDCCDPTEISETSESSYTTIEAKVRKCNVKKVKVVCHDKKKDKKDKKKDCGCDKPKVKKDKHAKAH